MVGFLCGMLVGSAITIILMCIVAINKDEEHTEQYYDKNKLTVEDCSHLKTKGFDVRIENGGIINVTESEE